MDASCRGKGEIFMTRFINTCRGFRSLPATLLTLVFAVICLSGCGGPSQEEMLMRAAQRRRAPEPQETEQIQDTGKEQAKANPNADQQISPAANGINAKPDPAPGQLAVSSQPVAKPPTTSETKRTFSVKPIEQRQPSTELNQTARRKVAQRNIETVANALQQYFAETKRLPQSYKTNANQLPTLSWRVTLLPYLGHEDLHQQFDFSKPWNVEPNKSLLQYIPDAYLSPERFDTNTNFLLPAGDDFTFGENRVAREKTIEDGMGNTIMLFEVNDEHAVPWTKPADLSANSRKELISAIGGLRENGTFAAWANGLPVLLSNTLSSEKIFQATTHEKGEPLRAGDIHRDIDEKVKSNVPSIGGTLPTSKDSLKPNAIPKNTTARLSVPKAGDIAEAQDKLRRIYADKLRDAKERSDKSKLARTMLTDAARARLDPTGAYVMQTAAMRLALEAVDIDLLITAIDQRIAQFEVDPYRENLNWLQQISAGRLKRDRTQIRSKRLTKRVLLVAHIGIVENDFAEASQIVGIAFQFSSRNNEELLPRLLNKLKASLTTADNEFKEALSDLDAYRKNPDNQETAAAFGMFLCFTKGDWDTGLPLLRKGDNEVLQEMARKDLQQGSDPDPQMQAELADMWWDLGERAKSVTYQQPCRERALHWYLQAYQLLPDSLDRIHIKSRIEEAEAFEGGNPVSLCRQLARELGVELSNSIEQITPNMRSRPNDDD